MDDVKIASFLALADTLNYTKAADMINKSQSVISRHIAAMESEMGISLFSRTTKDVSLTEAGRIIRSGFIDLSQRYNSILNSAKAAQNGFSGIITIGALIGQRIYNNYSQVINAFIKSHPDIKVELGSYGQKELVTRLHTGQLDFVIGAESEYIAVHDFEIYVVGYAKNCFAVPKTHRYADVPDENLSIRDFESDTWIMFTEKEAPMVQNSFLNNCAQMGISPKIIEGADISTMRRWIEANAGVAPLCETHVFGDSSAFKLKFLPEMGFTAESFVWNKYNENPCVKVFIQYMKKFFEKSSN